MHELFNGRSNNLPSKLGFCLYRLNHKSMCYREFPITLLAISLILRVIFLLCFRFAFHDIEDMCLVVDLLQGGDLRYHLGRIERFSEHDVCIYLLQVSSALEYLQGIKVIHR